MVASIIVPIFNIAPYINQCIDSLLPLLQCHCEIIMVAGQSTDSTNDIAQQYAEHYKPIKLIEQDGKGLSNARNAGLRIASGEWIVFVDGDDFIDSDVLDTILRKLPSEADILMTDFYRYYENGAFEQRTHDINDPCLCGLNDLPLAINPRKCFWNVWRNIYRRDFLETNALFFRENTYAEDIDYFSRVCLAQPVMHYSSEAFYHYRMDRMGSLMNDIPLIRLQQTVDVIEDCIQRLKKTDASWSESVISGFQFEYLLNMVFVSNFYGHERQQAVQLFASFARVLTSSNDCIVRWSVHIIRVVGIAAFSKQLRLLKSIKRKLEHRNA